MNYQHYYDFKYPYLNYPYIDNDGSVWIMYSIPVVGLIEMYRQKMKCRPDSFFDCGAAVGELVRQADEMGIEATGIDIKQYPYQDPVRQRYFDCGRIQIKSILDMDKVDADLVYCNGTLTYMTVKTLPMVLQKFKKVRMLIAIHNTTEDMRAAAAQGWQLLSGERRLIRSKKWWIKTFQQNGFDVTYDQKYNCFCAVPNNHNR